MSKNIDFEKAIQNLGGDPALFREVGVVFLTHLPQQVSNLHKAIDANDNKALESAAHTIKGSLGIYFNAEMINRAFEIEKMARSGDLTKAKSLVLEFEPLLELFKKEIEEFLKL